MGAHQKRTRLSNPEKHSIAIFRREPCHWHFDKLKEREMAVKKQITKARRIKQGIHFDRFSADFELTRMKVSLPEIVTIPLKQGFGCENICLVKKGDNVKAGQIIGRDDKSLCTPVHASVSGKVVDVVGINYVHEHLKESLREKIRAVKIETNAEELERPLEDLGPDWENTEPARVGQLLYLGGVSCLGQTGIPTQYASSPVSPQDIKNVIVNGVVSEPFVYSTTRFPQEIDSYIVGLRILRHIFPDATVHVAVDKSTFEHLSAPLSSLNKIELYSVDTSHPHGMAAVLIRSLLGDKILFGTFPSDRGILVVGQEVPLLVYQAVVKHRPFIRKKLSIGGSAVKEQAIVDVPIGTSLDVAIRSLLFKKRKFRLILGGALTGSYQEDLHLPIGKEISSVVILEERTTREFLSFVRPGLKKHSYSRAFLSSLISTLPKSADTGLHGEERTCISCGYCAQVCPVNILPYQIYRCFTHDFIDELERLRPLECIDCGLCSYVCPSKLPLTETLKECKSKLSEEFNFVAYQKKQGRLKLYKDFYRIPEKIS